MVLHRYPELLRDARELVYACTEGLEAHLIIAAADRYLATLLRVRRDVQAHGIEARPSDRAVDRFPLAERTRKTTQEQIRLKQQLASVQPALF